MRRVNHNNTMTDRKNLKVQPETFEALRAEKRDYETWDGLMVRLLEERE